MSTVYSATTSLKLAKYAFGVADDVEKWREKPPPAVELAVSVGTRLTELLTRLDVRPLSETISTTIETFALFDTDTSLKQKGDWARALLDTSITEVLSPSTRSVASARPTMAGKSRLIWPHQIEMESRSARFSSASVRLPPNGDGYDTITISVGVTDVAPLS